MGEYGIGQPVLRDEDPRLLQGKGRFNDDSRFVNQLYGVVLRSPYAHAKLVSLKTEAARVSPGVILILTGADYTAEKLGTLLPFPTLVAGFVPEFTPPYVPIAVEFVRYVGEPVAFVVAESRNEALDAVALIEAEYTILPSIIDTERCIEPSAPHVWPHRPGNTCAVYETGDQTATEVAFESADHVVSKTFRISRVMANAIEGRGSSVSYEPATDTYLVHASVQTTFSVRRQLASVFSESEDKFRVLSGDVGGSFGIKAAIYPETIFCAWAVRKLKRPVRWLADRSETYFSDYHGRDNFTEASLALDKSGKFLALKVHTTVNLGAYLSALGLGPAVNNLLTLTGVYTTPCAYVRVTAAFTNTVPTSPYRGAGRPEAAYVIESLVDLAARQLGLATDEIRKRNLIPRGAFPHTSALKFTYDCGDFARNLEMALEKSDHQNVESRRQSARMAGRLLGFGIANTIERSVIPGRPEFAEIRFDAEGKVLVLIGTTDQGQGHTTIFKQVINEHLGISPFDIRIIEGDTGLMPLGAGAAGSSGVTRGSGAILLAADKVIAKARKYAMRVLEVSERDLEFHGGKFEVVGTDRSISLQQIARALNGHGPLPVGTEAGLDETGICRPTSFSYPNSCHACELEIDEDTGSVTLLKYVVVDDVGTVLNPLLLEGQIIGGLAQSVGQALFEQVVYDNDTGQLLSGTFMDYAMPRADNFCHLSLFSNPVPTTTNPLGIKGAGEAGTVAALPAVVNAVNDALKHLKVPHVDMPATPERIWKVLRNARR